MYKVVLVIVTKLFFICFVKGECEINPISTNAPLIINAGGTDIQYPQYGQVTIKFATGGSAEFICPGGAVVLEGKSSGFPVASASCVSGTKFLVNGESYLWYQVTCNNDPVATSRFTGDTCAGGKEAEIGYDLEDGRFVQKILLCFDSTTQVSLYTQHKVIASIGSQATGVPRPSFNEDREFYDIGAENVNTLYLRSKQRKAINGLIGLSAKDTKYIKTDGLYFLSRGHMTAKADFFYPAEQNLTFKYINCAPQFQTLNGYNWDDIETSAKSYASKHNVNLQVWTGTYEVTTLPHESTGTATPLYIYVNGIRKAFPVPAIYWKVVYNPTSKQGVALIGVNNPYEKNVSKYVYCEDVSSNLSWVTWNRTSIVHGYSYACSIADLRKIINYVPSLTVSGLLV